jgi:hypothetical protein
MFVMQALQAEGSWREAERHFCEAKEWKAAVAMYRQQGDWEDALRVAKVFGGLAAAKQVRPAVTHCCCCCCLLLSNLLQPQHIFLAHFARVSCKAELAIR